MLRIIHGQQYSPLMYKVGHFEERAYIWIWLWHQQFFFFFWKKFINNKQQKTTSLHLSLLGFDISFFISISTTIFQHEIFKVKTEPSNIFHKIYNVFRNCYFTFVSLTTIWELVLMQTLRLPIIMAGKVTCRTASHSAIKIGQSSSFLLYVIKTLASLSLII